MPKVLDLGCGIGRHVKYAYEMQLDAYGIDLSDTAISIARSWLKSCGMNNAEARIVQGDVCHLPWSASYFDFAVSHGVLDSMSFLTARDACKELSRVMVPGGLFYCDLISGDDSAHSREYAGAEVVKTRHELNTIQLYFNIQLIKDLVSNLFEIVECKLIRQENVFSGAYSSRYHLVLSRI